MEIRQITKEEFTKLQSDNPEDIRVIEITEDILMSYQKICRHLKKAVLLRMFSYLFVFIGIMAAVICGNLVNELTAVSMVISLIAFESVLDVYYKYSANMMQKIARYSYIFISYTALMITLLTGFEVYGESFSMVFVYISGMAVITGLSYFMTLKACDSVIEYQTKMKLLAKDLQTIELPNQKERAC